jgi:hypothetical protein
MALEVVRDIRHGNTLDWTKRAAVIVLAASINYTHSDNPTNVFTQLWVSGSSKMVGKPVCSRACVGQGGPNIAENRSTLQWHSRSRCPTSTRGSALQNQPDSF